jgi:hypothetical protein
MMHVLIANNENGYLNNSSNAIIIWFFLLNKNITASYLFSPYCIRKTIKDITFWAEGSRSKCLYTLRLDEKQVFDQQHVAVNQIPWRGEVMQ